MINTDNIKVEQLWYTWSDVGLSTVGAGFRIRAASPDVIDIYSERVKSMDQYMRYVLPYGTDRFAITPEMAPVCLGYLRTDQGEYIIVHKKYIGKDAFGRIGNFFVHLLACGQHPDVSFIDNTTSLWEAQFWKDSDAGLNRHATALEPTTLSKLNEAANKFRANYAEVRKFLPFLITAYLMRKKDPPTQLYIAAPARSIRLMVVAIEGLIACLPLPLLKDLTFSTYEPDVTKTTALIVGTSWIDVPGKPASPHIFPPQFYQQQLAVNFATGDQSTLHNHPLIDDSLDFSLAERFAQHATQCLLSGDTKDLDTLREQAEHDLQLTVKIFLSTFSDTVISLDKLSSSKIEYYLKNPEYRINKLSNPDFRQKIIDHALNDPRWWISQLMPLMLELRQQGEQELATPVAEHVFNKDAHFPQRGRTDQPQFTQRPPIWRRRHIVRPEIKQMSLIAALALFSDSATDRIISYYAKPITSQHSGRLTVLLQMIASCTLPEKEELAEAVRSLLKGFHANSNSNAYKGLVNDWPSLLQVQHLGMALSDESSDVQAISPFLVVPWSHLGAFLSLNLYQEHWQWLVVVVGKLAHDSSLTEDDARLLRQQYSSALDKLLQELLKKPDQWLTTADFMIRLTERRYTDIAYMQRQVTLLNHLTTATKPDAWLAARDIVVALAKVDHINQALYSICVQQLIQTLVSNKKEDVVKGLCHVLVVSHNYAGKADLLPALLNSPTRYHHLKEALTLIYPTLQERDNFFLLHGAQYLASLTYIQDMLSLYEELRASSRNMQRLSIVLASPLREEEKVKILSVAGPEKQEEYVEFLYRYGKLYLQGYQQSRLLADYIIECYGELAKLGYAQQQKLCFDLFQWAVADQHLESLLTLASPLSPEECISFFRTYGMDKRYIPFCRQSSIVLNWFSSLVQYAQTPLGAFPKKMGLVLLWLDPATTKEQMIGPKTLEAVAKILPKALLTQDEEKQFLEHLGTVYLPYAKDLYILKDFIQRYIHAFAASDLERKEAMSFLTHLHEHSSSLGLEPVLARRLGAWQTVHAYLANPSPYPSGLFPLAKAVCVLNLEDDATFVAKLAKEFTGWIRIAGDLYTIMSNFSCINKKEQLFYNIAEQSAETYKGKIANLKIYIVFILYHGHEIAKTNLKYFIKEFIDTLLTYISVDALPAWKQLHNYVSSQNLSQEAVDRWHEYVTNLGLADKILIQQDHGATQMAANHRQSLPYEAAFIAEQIREVDSYVRNGKDLQEVIQRVKHVKEKEQFFYDIAEEKAKNYRNKIDVLGSYILFIFRFVQETNYTNEYMILVFLDTLLPPINGMDDPTWMALDGYVRNRAPSQGVLKQWDAYVQRLGLFSSWQGGAGFTSRVQPRLLPPRQN